MEEQRNSFTFYRSFWEAAEDLSDQDQAELFRAICRFALDREEPQLKGYMKAIFATIRAQLNANWIRYLNGIKGKEDGAKGGAPKGNKNAAKAKDEEAKQPQNNPKTTPNIKYKEQNIKNKEQNTKREESKNALTREDAPSSLSVDVEREKHNFVLEVQKYAGKYEPKLLAKFAAYYAAVNKETQLMRWQEDKYFNIENKLEEWKAREPMFGNNNGSSRENNTARMYQDGAELVEELIATGEKHNTAESRRDEVAAIIAKRIAKDKAAELRYQEAAGLIDRLIAEGEKKAQFQREEAAEIQSEIEEIPF